MSGLLRHRVIGIGGLWRASYRYNRSELVVVDVLAAGVFAALSVVTAIIVVMI